MRNMLVVVALVVSVHAADADPQSPRIAALAAKPATTTAFWKQVADEGTPIVEDVHDPKGRLLVTFVYRAGAATTHVAAYKTPSMSPWGYMRLERVPGTDVFAGSVLVDPAARFTYWLAPDDDLGPPPPQGDMSKRTSLFRADLLNKHLVPSSSWISATLELPRAPAQPDLVPRRDSPAGEVVEYEVKSKSLGNTRSVFVYTPPGFSTKHAPYPLVVLFDGEAAIANMDVPVILDNLSAAKKIPPVVAVMIGNADRTKELPHHAAFADFVALDLVPWARRTFHTTSDPGRTVISGISLGGIAATFAAVRHPAVYGNVLSQSGSFWWSPDDEDEGEAHARELAAVAPLPLRFWLEVGQFEGGSGKPGVVQRTANRHFRDVLVARGYDASYREFAGAHEYINWRGTIGDGLVALLAKPPRFKQRPPASPGRATGIEVGSAKKMLATALLRTAVIEDAAATRKWLETQDPSLVTEDRVNEAAYVLLELGFAKQAIPILEWNVERFPKSSNAYDSVADAFNRAGDRAKSIANYKRSLELDPKNDNAAKMLEVLR